MTMELLSRIQFAFTVSFHILFPAFSIGLATFLMIFEAIWLKTNKIVYLNICRFWTKVFALTFGMGVVSGIVMEFQFGTNWAGFAGKVGPVLGALFTYEVLTAFFIEAGALGVMIFGWNKVPKWLHFLATFVIWLGVTISAFWILSANSWMQTPAGVHYEHGKFLITNWEQVIFNPSVIPRYIHMLFAAYISTLLAIVGICAFYLHKKRHVKFAYICLKFALPVLAILSITQVFIGDGVGREVHQYQPIKTAAIEGVWKTQNGAPLVLLGWPNMETRHNDFALELPHLAALINTHKWNGRLQGLDSVPAEDRPYVPFVFYSFRVMVGIGFISVIMAIGGTLLLRRKKLLKAHRFQKALVLCAPLGFIALLAGWFTAEGGRQPWAVYGILRTKDVVSDLHAWQVATSLIALTVVYFVIFGFFYFRYFLRILKKGPTHVKNARMPFGYFQSVEQEHAKKENK